MKLTDILNEIKVVPGGRQILWGRDEQGRFTELVKLRGFKTPQEALDKINQLLGLKEEGDKYYMNVPYYNDVINPTYAYLAGDGDTTFVKDLSEFGDSYTTEEGWSVVEWSKEPPF
jgi:hypothetical protein